MKNNSKNQVISQISNSKQSNWKSILKKQYNNTTVYESTIEKVEFDKRYGQYYYPLIIYFNSENKTIMFLGVDEWKLLKVYKQRKNRLIPFDYKNLKKGDIIEVSITTAIDNSGKSYTKELLMVKK